MYPSGCSTLLPVINGTPDPSLIPQHPGRKNEQMIQNDKQCHNNIYQALRFSIYLTVVKKRARSDELRPQREQGDFQRVVSGINVFVVRNLVSNDHQINQDNERNLKKNSR